MKVREIIEIEGWVNGGGFNYKDTYSDEIIEVAAENTEELRETFSWGFWERSEPVEGEDLKITVKYYAPDADLESDSVEPIAVFETWESEI